MPYSTSPTDILTSVAGTLVAEQKFASIEEALKELALSAVRGKAMVYQRRIKRLERKYSADFDTFSADLVGQATPAEEDDWLEWRSALRMFADWQQTYQDLLNDRVR